MLIGWSTLIISAVGFLLIFNLSQAPIFERLREVPYIGRLGTLTTSNSETGQVRVLIWSGDEHAGGSVALIQSNPLRAIIGWGPESMFVAFNPFYPPSLTRVEVRGASPDRAHQAQLDELITKGVLGLASHLFLLLSILFLCWRLMRQSREWRWKVFFMACMSAIVAHIGEGLTGIPVVSSLMMFWIIAGMVVASGAIAGHYWQTPLPEHTAAPSRSSRQESGTRRRGGAVRGSMQRSSGASRKGDQALGGQPLAYALIASVALLAIMFFNVNPVRADMHFHQTQSGAEQGNLAGLTRSLTGYLETIRIAPREDIYYISVGRTLMSLADLQRTQGREVGTPTRDVRFEELLQLNGEQEVAAFIQRETPANLLSFADAVLQRARALNPLNKDHYANLGRLHSYWYRLAQDRAQLLVALDWYEQVGPIAPQDVTLINERAGVLMLLSELERNSGNRTQADDYAMEANNLLRRSLEVDDQNADTFLRLGELLRQAYGDLDGAVTAYSQAIMRSGRTVAGSIETIASALSGRPDLIVRLREAYTAHILARTAVLEQQALTASEQQELALLHAVVGILAARTGEAAGAVEAYRQATALEPTNPIYSRNYALVLSDTLRHDEAIVEAQRMAALLRNRAGSEQSLSEVEYLITLLEQARGR
jgi:tetratricopeptide (TPR) repeat protein